MPRTQAQAQARRKELLGMLAGQLKALPNHLLLEGHTDAQPYSPTATYTNWELSADRANSARRLLQQDGVRQDQISQVRGFADQFLRVKNNPLDPSNRRISLIVQWITMAAPKIPAGAEAAKESGDAKSEPKLPTAEKPSSPVPATSSANSPGTKPTAAKPSVMDRLKGIIPGTRKK